MLRIPPAHRVRGVSDCRPVPPPAARGPGKSRDDPEKGAAAAGHLSAPCQIMFDDARASCWWPDAIEAAHQRARTASPTTVLVACRASLADARACCAIELVMTVFHHVQSGDADKRVVWLTDTPSRSADALRRCVSARVRSLIMDRTTLTDDVHVGMAAGADPQTSVVVADGRVAEHYLRNAPPGRGFAARLVLVVRRFENARLAETAAKMCLVRARACAGMSDALRRFGNQYNAIRETPLHNEVKDAFAAHAVSLARMTSPPWLSVVAAKRCADPLPSLPSLPSHPPPTAVKRPREETEGAGGAKRPREDCGAGAGEKGAGSSAGSHAGSSGGAGVLAATLPRGQHVCSVAVGPAAVAAAVWMHRPCSLRWERLELEHVVDGAGGYAATCRVASGLKRNVELDLHTCIGTLHRSFPPADAHDYLLMSGLWPDLETGALDPTESPRPDDAGEARRHAVLGVSPTIWRTLWGTMQTRRRWMEVVVAGPTSGDDLERSFSAVTRGLGAALRHCSPTDAELRVVALHEAAHTAPPRDDPLFLRRLYYMDASTPAGARKTMLAAQTARDAVLADGVMLDTLLEDAREVDSEAEAEGGERSHPAPERQWTLLHARRAADTTQVGDGREPHEAQGKAPLNVLYVQTRPHVASIPDLDDEEAVRVYAKALRCSATKQAVRSTLTSFAEVWACLPSSWEAEEAAWAACGERLQGRESARWPVDRQSAAQPPARPRDAP